MKFEAASLRGCVKIKVYSKKNVIVRRSETLLIHRLDSTPEGKFTTLASFNVTPSTWRRNNLRGRVGQGFHVGDDVVFIKIGVFLFLNPHYFILLRKGNSILQRVV